MKLTVGSLVFTVILAVGVGMGAVNDTQSVVVAPEPTFTQACSEENLTALVSYAGGDAYLTPSRHQLGATWVYQGHAVEFTIPPRIVTLHPGSKNVWGLPGMVEASGHFQLACIPAPPPLIGVIPIQSTTITTPIEGATALPGTWTFTGPKTLHREGALVAFQVPPENVLVIPDRNGFDHFYLPGDVVEVESFDLHYHPSMMGQYIYAAP